MEIQELDQTKSIGCTVEDSQERSFSSKEQPKEGLTEQWVSWPNALLNYPRKLI